MQDDVVIRYADAFACGVCTSSRSQLTELGIDWRTFVKKGYTESELYAALGKDHIIVKQIADYVREKQREAATHGKP